MPKRRMAKSAPWVEAIFRPLMTWPAPSKVPAKGVLPLGDTAALARADADGRPFGALKIYVGAEGHVFAVVVVACVHGIAEGR